MKSLTPFFSVLLLVALSAMGPDGLAAQTVRGRLFDNDTREPVVNGTVTLVDSMGVPVARVLTGPDGAFSLSAPEPGSYTLRGQGLGYRGGLQTRVDLVEGEEVVTDVYLVPAPLQMDSLSVSVDRVRSELERQGFFRRRKQGRGFFLSPGQLSVRPPVTEAEVVARAPFVRISRSWTGSTILMREGGRACRPAIYIDDFPAQVRPFEGRVVLEDHVNAADIRAIEVYRGLGQIPQELAVGTQSCGVILIWTVWSELRNRGSGGMRG